MDTTPTQVFVDTTDDSIWSEGKTLMPTITQETFLSNTSNNRGSYVIVPKKYDKAFSNALPYPKAKLVNKTKLASIYKLCCFLILRYVCFNRNIRNFIVDESIQWRRGCYLI